MRALPALTAAVSLVGAALIGATPAQAADNALTVALNIQTGEATVTAPNGMAGFGDDEELQISIDAPGRRATPSSRALTTSS